MKEVNQIKSEDFQGGVFPDLAVLYPEELEAMYAAASVQMFDADYCVLEEGQRVEHLYLVKAGLLRVIKQHAGNTYEVASIVPGQMFGEASMIYHGVAGAEVRTMEPAILYSIPFTVMYDILEGNERFLRATTQLAEKRSAATAIAVNPIFSTLPMAVREVLLFNARFLTLAEGEVLLAEGENDDHHIFLVLAGRLSVELQHPTKKQERIYLSQLSSGDEAGEISIVTGLPHMATVTALEPVRVMAIASNSVVAWARRYTDFAYALYGLVYRKLKQTQDILKGILSKEEAKVLTLNTMPSLEEFKRQHHL